MPPASPPPSPLPTGFFLLPIHLTGDAPCQPHLYVKVHRGDDDGEGDDGETLHHHQQQPSTLSSSSLPPRLSDSRRHKPRPHAVFVVGLPLLWRPLAPVLESLFGAYGEVEAVAVHPNKLSAIVSFASPSALSTLVEAATARSAATLHLPPLSSTATKKKKRKKRREEMKRLDDDAETNDDDIIVDEIDDPARPLGLKRWVEAHKALTRPGNAALAARLDAWVDAYEREAEAAAAAAARAASGDGWTLVTRGDKGRKRRRASGGGSGGGENDDDDNEDDDAMAIPAGSVATASGGVAPAAAAAAAEAKAKRLAADFYRFRARDARRDELAALRSRFEEDRARVAALRAARKFRPE